MSEQNEAIAPVDFRRAVIAGEEHVIDSITSRPYVRHEIDNDKLRFNGWLVIEDLQAMLPSETRVPLYVVAQPKEKKDPVIFFLQREVETEPTKLVEASIIALDVDGNIDQDAMEKSNSGGPCIDGVYQSVGIQNPLWYYLPKDLLLLSLAEEILRDAQPIDILSRVTEGMGLLDEVANTHWGKILNVRTPK